MQHRIQTTLFASALLAGGVLAGSGTTGGTTARSTGDLLRFQAAEGLRLQKTIVTTHELNLDEMGMTREGGPLMRESIGGWLTSGTRQVVVDEYLSVADGRPQVFRRTYRNIEGHGKMNLSGGRGRIEERAFSGSGMKGQTLIYTWVEEENDYARTHDQIYGEERQLQELEGDMDLLVLLPEGEVEEGASWSVDPAAMKSVLAPGGNTRAQPVEDGFFSRMIEVGLGGDLADVLGRLEGSVRATYRGIRQVDGRDMAAIDLEITLNSRRDRTRAYVVGMPKEEKREATQLDKVSIGWTLNGEGELLWDVGAGHAHQLRILGHESFTAEIFKQSTAETAEPMSVTQRTTYSGQIDHEFKLRETKVDPVAAGAGSGKPKKKKKKAKDQVESEDEAQDEDR